jgi:hypothetical protein
MVEPTERDWVEEIGKPAAESVAEMVAALECDYDRLEELKDEREHLADLAAEAADADPEDEPELAAAAEGRTAELANWDENNGEELAELTEAAGECKDQDEARERIQEDALSVEVRSDWYAPGDSDADRKPAEFRILLCTGGPAVCIEGELNEHGEPTHARLLVQDWFKPWTEYLGVERDTLLAYARCFYFGE